MKGQALTGAQSSEPLAVLWISSDSMCQINIKPFIGFLWTAIR
jgi:hypothetical protein